MTIQDSDILTTLQKNPETGFKDLVSKYAGCIYWHIRRIVISHHDAEDVTQEVFLRIFKSLSGMSDARSLRSWIYRIATNEALRYLEKSGRQTIALQDASLIEPMSDPYINYDDV